MGYFSWDSGVDVPRGIFVPGSPFFFFSLPMVFRKSGIKWCVPALVCILRSLCACSFPASSTRISRVLSVCSFLFASPVDDLSCVLHGLHVDLLGHF